MSEYTLQDVYELLRGNGDIMFDMYGDSHSKRWYDMADVIYDAIDLIDALKKLNGEDK